MLKTDFAFGKSGVFLILLAENYFTDIGPGNGYFRIVIDDAAFIFGMVKLVTFVSELGIIADHSKAVGKPTGNEELPLILFRQENTRPFAIGGAAGTKVNSNIKYFTLQDTDKLGLRKTLLKMEAAENTLAGTGLIVLNEGVVKTDGFKIRLLIGLHKVTAIVTVGFDIDDIDIFDCGFCESEIAGLHVSI